VFPAWTQATRWEDRQAPFIAKTCRSILRYFESCNSNRKERVTALSPWRETGPQLDCTYGLSTLTVKLAGPEFTKQPGFPAAEHPRLTVMECDWFALAFVTCEVTL
jgi:hypothetical protein